MLILCGLRRGEALGLRWDDIDFEGGTILIHQQLQRVRGELFLAPVKTQAGRRGLPLLDPDAQALSCRPNARAPTGSIWALPGRKPGSCSPPGPGGRSSRATSSGPSGASADTDEIRLIKVHHVRHTVGSLLKDLGVPARDAQSILGHTRISTTLEIYTDTGEQARRDALTRLHGLLDEAKQ